jgi:urease beta subunit
MHLRDERKRYQDSNNCCEQIASHYKFYQSRKALKLQVQELGFSGLRIEFHVCTAVPLAICLGMKHT